MFFIFFLNKKVQSEVNPPSKEYTVTINQTKDIWFHCSVDQHCASGMKGYIKVTSNQTSDAITIPKSFIALSFGTLVSSFVSWL